jgi:crotonobetainyl-CoA:carnitine CoA-transferase CaiB-like acyl-CoA transferase
MKSCLTGTFVLDASRMLPGAVLARQLLDLGARVVKVEDPATGDPMRLVPPLVDGIGAAFCAFYAGAESVCLDLRTDEGASSMARLARRADVLVESFRPGTLDRWGLGFERLAEANSRLIVCSLSSYGQAGPYAARVGHDLNFVALSGLLSMMPGEGLPRAQFADVSAGLLGCSAVLAALLERSRTGRGGRIDVSLSRSVDPFLALARAEAKAGGRGISDDILAGGCPAYGVYECAGGSRVALAALEPKFWVSLVEALGLGELADVGLDTGEEGRAAIRRLEARFLDHPREHWLAIAEKRGLPLTPVLSVEEAARDPHFAPNVGGAVPRLGEHTDRVLAEAETPHFG